MNAIRLQEILSVRYNTDWAGLRNKLSTIYKPGSVCSYCNHLSSRPVGHTMQKTLKAKIQNALSLSSYNDADCPALFVGGRRRNRRKKKNKNGQAKKKVRKAVVHKEPVAPSSPTPDSSFGDELVIYTGRRSPKVSCLDIQEPVFHENVTQNKVKVVEENDSVYGSNGSLESCLSGDDHTTNQVDTLKITEVETESEVIQIDKSGLPRTHSEDSGVFDDELVEDAGYEEADEDELDNSITDDAFENDISSDESFAEIFKDDEQVVDSEQCEPSCTNECLDSIDFDEIDLHEEEDFPEYIAQGNTTDEESIQSELDRAEKIAKQDANVTEGADEDVNADIREVKDIIDVVSFVNIEHQEGEDDIIFDLSQLELNNTQEEFSKIPKNSDVTMLSEVLYNPTELEETVPLRVPMDLLIDDDDKDEVLFEAAKKKDLSITCNPLYEHTLREEEERLSIKSYQSGFTTDFDNINLIQIPTTATNKASTKSVKESSPLISRQPARGEEDNELACCVIL